MTRGAVALEVAGGELRRAGLRIAQEEVAGGVGLADRGAAAAIAG